MSEAVLPGSPAVWNPSPEPVPGTAPAGAPLAAVSGIPVQLTVVLGRARMRIGELLQLTDGAVVELDRKVTDAVEILINNRLVARGEVVLVEGRIGVAITELVAGP